MCVDAKALMCIYKYYIWLRMGVHIGISEKMTIDIHDHTCMFFSTVSSYIILSGNITPSGKSTHNRGNQEAVLTGQGTSSQTDLVHSPSSPPCILVASRNKFC